MLMLTPFLVIHAQAESSSVARMERSGIREQTRRMRKAVNSCVPPADPTTWL